MENLARKRLKCINFRGTFSPKLNFFPPGGRELNFEFYLQAHYAQKQAGLDCAELCQDQLGLNRFMSGSVLMFIVRPRTTEFSLKLEIMFNFASSDCGLMNGCNF